MCKIEDAIRGPYMRLFPCPPFASVICSLMSSPPDLNAVLSLQPTNSEALAELARLLAHHPPARGSDTGVNAREERPGGSGREIPLPSSSASASSSSSTHERILSPLSPSYAAPSSPKEPKSKQLWGQEDHQHYRHYEQVKSSLPPPPWPRKKADEQRIRVVLLPFTSSRGGPGNAEKEGDRKKKKSNLDVGDDKSTPKEKGQGKAREKEKMPTTTKKKRSLSQASEAVMAESMSEKRMRMKEMIEEMSKGEGMVYPSWERYCVKRWD